MMIFFNDIAKIPPDILAIISLKLDLLLSFDIIYKYF